MTYIYFVFLTDLSRYFYLNCSNNVCKTFVIFWNFMFSLIKKFNDSAIIRYSNIQYCRTKRQVTILLSTGHFYKHIIITECFFSSHCYSFTYFRDLHDVTHTAWLYFRFHYIIMPRSLLFHCENQNQTVCSQLNCNDPIHFKFSGCGLNP